jgi:uncharacterized protein
VARRRAVGNTDRSFRTLLAGFETLRRTGRLTHSVQTNATLISPGWCALFAEYRFQIGVSIDGPAIQNERRRDWSGRATFERTMRGIGLLREAGIAFTAICVVSPETIGQADSLIAFFERLGCTSVGFNIEEQEGGNACRSPVTAEEAERFWLSLWRSRDAGSQLPVRDLDRLCDWLDRSRVGIAGRTQPFDPIPTVSFNGDVVVLSPELLGIRAPDYDNFVLGNVLTQTISSMLATAGAAHYVREFADGLRACAATCEFFSFCQGAQAGNRFFEHGTFAATETAHCRNTRQALVRAALAHLSTEGGDHHDDTGDALVPTRSTDRPARYAGC